MYCNTKNLFFFNLISTLNSYNYFYNINSYNNFYNELLFNNLSIYNNTLCILYTFFKNTILINIYIIIFSYILSKICIVYYIFRYIMVGIICLLELRRFIKKYNYIY